KAQDIKTYLVLKCKERMPQEVQIKLLWDIQSEDRNMQSGTFIFKKRSNNSILLLDAYYNLKEAIDKAKEARANKALIKWKVYSRLYQNIKS
ncbi:19623_t:CDS:2, partial [Dentiscutata erythropus]